jgi:hypothetical protein
VGDRRARVRDSENEGGYVVRSIANDKVIVTRAEDGLL